MDITERIRAAFRILPQPVRLFIRDAIEGGIAAVIVLNLAFPHTTAEAQSQAIIIGTALVAPIIAAARRTLLPAIIAAWGRITSEDEG